jgi:DNA-3-methyladenine glycosylase
MKTRFRQAFFERPARRVARDLLGTILVRRTSQTVLAGIVTEVEAYTQSDPASHSFRGKTRRNEVMFSRGGLLYVYFTYGMHYCSNVVTGPEGVGEAVLLRAVEPIAGISSMQKRRHGSVHLADGPAKLCQAFDFGRTQNGASLLGPELFILPGVVLPPYRMRRTPRIGIRVATEKKWRFMLKGTLRDEEIEQCQTKVTRMLEENLQMQFLSEVASGI